MVSIEFSFCLSPPDTGLSSKTQWNVLIYVRPPRTLIRIFLLPLSLLFFFFCPFTAAPVHHWSRKNNIGFAKAGMEQIAKVGIGDHMSKGVVDASHRSPRLPTNLSCFKSPCRTLHSWRLFSQSIALLFPLPRLLHRKTRGKET